jgi:hypothetical protein
MVLGMFEDGTTPIIDPDNTHQNLGAWHSTDGKTHRAKPHLNHFHVEMKKRGNSGR